MTTDPPVRAAEVPSGVASSPTASPRMSPWRFVVAFGVVSLLMDVVYEGARAVTGPVLAGLGASAVTVGVVTGAGEAAALGLRLVSGPLADRTGRFWTWTVAGYLLTALSVPLLGLAGALPVACALVVGERVGKAVRSPAKDTLLSHATGAVGRGRGFAVHEAIDQVGAVAGPLAVAGVLAWTGSYRLALGVLALPALAAVVLLLRLCRAVPDPTRYDHTPEPGGTGPGGTGEQPGAADPLGAIGRAPSGPVPAGAPAGAAATGGAGGLPGVFWWHVAFTSLTTAGASTFGVLSFHLVHDHVVRAALIPVLYAVAMGVDALAALANGWTYDRRGPTALAALPVLSALALLGFSSSPVLAVLGVGCWAAALGVQESTLRAYVADTVPRERRATAYGLYAGVLGVAILLGGTLTGLLYTHSTRALVLTVVTIQALALTVLARDQIHRRTTSGRDPAARRR